MDPVLVSLDAGVLRVTLNRPDTLNAFTQAMHEHLAAAMTRAESEAAVRCVLITGAGRGFCAGQDLSERDMNDPKLDLGGGLDARYNPLVRRMRALEKPIVGAVNGVAAGAGANFALACDLVIAARSASFVQSFARLGLVPDSGGTWLLPRLLGQARAMGLALLGEKLPAEQAQEWGLIWKAVDDDELMPFARQMATALAEGPTRGYGLLKKAFNASWGNSLDAQLDLERDLQREAGLTQDYREGVAAFMQKRKPEYKGK
jgi:2-(1,2-epoxy-1,2-dihydrophenyl)acetyl-CoA isomerase